MERDVADIKRSIDRLVGAMERIVDQTDQLEEELRKVRTLLERQEEREEAQIQQANNEKKW